MIKLILTTFEPEDTEKFQNMLIEAKSLFDVGLLTGWDCRLIVEKDDLEDPETV